MNTLDGSQKWVKTRVEFVDRECILGTVAMDSGTDWSLRSGTQTGQEVTVEMVRVGDNLEVFEVVGKSGRRVMVRKVSWVFGGEFPGEYECWVGAYVAKPMGCPGDVDVVVRFRDLVVESNGTDIK